MPKSKEMDLPLRVPMSAMDCSPVTAERRTELVRTPRVDPIAYLYSVGE